LFISDFLHAKKLKKKKKRETQKTETTFLHRNVENHEAVFFSPSTFRSRVLQRYAWNA